MSVAPLQFLVLMFAHIANKYDGTARRGCGRSTTAASLQRLVVQCAAENPDRRYTRLRGALHNLGHELVRNAIERRRSTRRGSTSGPRSKGNMGNRLQVLMVTSEWPDPAHPNWVPFLVEQVASLKNAGVDVRVFSFRGAKNPWNYTKAWLSLHNLIKTGRYDLVHAQYGQSALIALPRRLPLVVTFHGSDLMGDTDHRGRYTLPGKLLVVLSKLVSHYADSIIVVANHLGQKLPGGIKYHIIPTGIDLARFRPISMIEAREKLDLPKNKKIILFGGRPEMPVKRYSLAQKAISLLQRDQVELLTVSNVSHEQMPLYLNAADVLLLTSRHEGSPTIVREALACNLPIVSTDVGDVRERIGSIAGCMVCDDDRPETIAASLRTILARDQPINGRTAVKDFDERKLTQKVISIYHHALVRT